MPSQMISIRGDSKLLALISADKVGAGSSMRIVLSGDHTELKSLRDRLKGLTEGKTEFLASIEEGETKARLVFKGKAENWSDVVTALPSGSKVSAMISLAPRK